MAAGILSTSNMSDRQMLEVIMKKLDALEGIQATLNSVVDRVVTVENRLSDLDTQVADIDKGVSFMETEFEELKFKVKTIEDNYVPKSELQEANRQIIDLSNRLRRNNLVMHNVPEGKEGTGKDADCLSYVKNFLLTEVGMDPVPEIQVAHRSGRPKKSGNQTGDETNRQDKPEPVGRPIHVMCTYRPDRDVILRAAVAALKDKETDIYFTDDVHPYTRNVQKQLTPIMEDMRVKGWLAYIPWTVPRVIKYKSTPKGTPGPLKTYRLREDFTNRWQ